MTLLVEMNFFPKYLEQINYKTKIWQIQNRTLPQWKSQQSSFEVKMNFLQKIWMSFKKNTLNEKKE